MLTRSYQYKVEAAEIIVEQLKKTILDICWNDNPDELCNSHDLIPWIQEEAEYQIKHLHLPERESFYFYRKIDQTVGEYAELV
ncbi:MAG TPA: hypothetical protein VJ909_06600 [Prolixibacteraceae bacterium]|nr:hypothetical protein [Prolixibacteraceae bacterium]